MKQESLGLSRGECQGDPTSRERLFIQACRGRRPIVWPEPTHAPRKALNGNGDRGLFDAPPRRAPYRTAREIIDWSIPGQSIFERKRPLSPNTLARILKGIEKFCGIPFVIGAGGPQDAGAPISINSPLRTIPTEDHKALVQPFLVKYYGGAHAQSVD